MARQGEYAPEVFLGAAKSYVFKQIWSHLAACKKFRVWGLSQYWLLSSYTQPWPLQRPSFHRSHFLPWYWIQLLTSQCLCSFAFLDLSSHWRHIQFPLFIIAGAWGSSRPMSGYLFYMHCVIINLLLTRYFISMQLTIWASFAIWYFSIYYIR